MQKESDAQELTAPATLHADVTAQSQMNWVQNDLKIQSCKPRIWCKVFDDWFYMKKCTSEPVCYTFRWSAASHNIVVYYITLNVFDYYTDKLPVCGPS